MQTEIHPAIVKIDSTGILRSEIKLSKKEWLAKFVCLDCGINTRDSDEYYMIWNWLWEELVPEHEGMLCIGCLETRLGRKLTAADFTDCRLNDLGWVEERSDRLYDRLEAVEK